MKYLLCIIILFPLYTFSQPVNTTRFQLELLKIVNDAAKGFPLSIGYVKEDIGWFGTKYNSRLAIFSGQPDTYLQYIKAQDNKYSSPTNESFYFSQSFQSTSTAGRWMLDSAEKVLDEVAMSAKLSKTVVKQSKENRKTYKTIAYRTGNKTVFEISTHLPSKNVYLTINSPFRPGNVAAPANLLGTMAFYYSNTSFMYLVPVYGDTMPDKQKLGNDVAVYSDMASSYHKWEWFPGRSVSDLQKQYGRTMSIKEMNSYTVK